MPVDFGAREALALRRAAWLRPHVLLVVVAGLHALSPLLLLGAHWWFGIDETVYLSQLNAHVPAGLFSAPRARGPTLLAAPVTLLTSAPAAARIWLAVLSGLGCYLGFRPWLRLRPGYGVPLAALLFSTVWVVIFYGDTVMPNEWVAYGALGATGLLLRYAAEGRRRQLGGVGAALAWVGLFRPSDALYLTVALILCALPLRASRRRRGFLVVALVVGFAAGVAEWVIEAYVRYGGPAARLHAAQAENGGGGAHFAGAAQARALAGPVLCRNGCHVHAALVYQLWWIALAVFVTIGVLTARRTPQWTGELVSLMAGLALAAQYVFAVTYAAPRFLLPAYALLSLPCASGVLRSARLPRRPPARVALGSALGVALALHAVIQIAVVTRHIVPRALHDDHAILAGGRALRLLGVHSPCLVLGDPGWNQELAYLDGCSNTVPSAAGLQAKLADGTDVIWLTRRQPADRRDVSWRGVRLAWGTGTGLTAYLGSPVSGPVPGGSRGARRPTVSAGTHVS